jgi:hypothetical protein
MLRRLGVVLHFNELSVIRDKLCNCFAALIHDELSTANGKLGTNLLGKPG